MFKEVDISLAGGEYVAKCPDCKQVFATGNQALADQVFLELEEHRRKCMYPHGVIPHLYPSK